jgi:hypothetical protein
MSYYPDPNDDDFQMKIFKKREFYYHTIPQRDKMKSYVQLKDGIAFSVLTTEGEITPNDTLIEIEGNAEAYLNKKYENGSFVDATLIKYAVIQNDMVYKFQKTYFVSDVTGPIVSSDDVSIGWGWDGTNFVAPTVPDEPVPEAEA